jgi:hypothetical protein
MKFSQTTIYAPFENNKIKLYILSMECNRFPQFNHYTLHTTGKSNRKRSSSTLKAKGGTKMKKSSRNKGRKRKIKEIWFPDFQDDEASPSTSPIASNVLLRNRAKPANESQLATKAGPGQEPFKARTNQARMSQSCSTSRRVTSQQSNSKTTAGSLLTRGLAAMLDQAKADDFQAADLQKLQSSIDGYLQKHCRKSARNTAGAVVEEREPASKPREEEKKGTKRLDVFYGRTDNTMGFKEYACCVVRTAEAQIKYYDDVYEPWDCEYEVLWEVSNYDVKSKFGFKPPSTVGFVAKELKHVILRAY